MMNVTGLSVSDLTKIQEIIERIQADDLAPYVKKMEISALPSGAHGVLSRKFPNHRDKGYNNEWFFTQGADPTPYSRD